ncbi:MULTISPECIES: DUF4262 domain-containing protein [unclassified Mesorhizobium]|uniref:DUF4262 domain-containing protein n=1 Tax=unclassified Mesorhizobium TaxID=325217 RepID=UPI000FD6C80F|nr:MULTISPECIES: DUF4262 domain-containing protein [unclassified Mesorhizobium]TGQ17282.1 DUF4262 domain-containing protein [Mesorhizobium sp. M2E.F.Ca.ET.219.01.1.1]TGT76561.1 DUF4262 domain-containing protein [Mesorhizobium sp. M2E.F.Ca.ET.166.01.1.1]TGW02674.1 DUF4262 domain-containing protein [Mesorhizobium sp. M2E.F.Ca.ET.154.01.1.1]
MPNRKAKDAEEAKALADIEEYGCHILYVLEEDEHPPFAIRSGSSTILASLNWSSSGSSRSSRCNEYCRRVRDGERFRVGERASGFLGGGFDCQFGAVHPDHYPEYFGWDIWFYDGPDFRIMQLIFPTTSGVWPWDAEADEWFRKRQPLLDAPP